MSIRTLALLTALMLQSFVQRASAQIELPNLWKPDAAYYNYQFTIDMSHGDPFTVPYNSQLNYQNPQSLPPEANRDTAYDYFLFEPKRANGQPTGPRPLIVYFHGAALTPRPTDIRPQIEHYVRSGFSVLWMPYCDLKSNCIDFVRYEGNAMTALFDARYQLWQSNHVGLAQDSAGREKVIFVAHSLGAHVATRVAGALAAFNQGWGVLPVPRALIFHDAAGYAATVDSACIAAVGPFFGPALANLVKDQLRQKGWAWKNAAGQETFELKDVLPLPSNVLAALPSDTLVLLLGADASKNGANAVETAKRIYHYAPVTKKRAYVVPSQCVTRTNSTTLNYVCPTSLTASAHDTSKHHYFSFHDLFGNGNDNLKEASVILQTTACAFQTELAVEQALCTGANATYTGFWKNSNGTNVKTTLPKVTWSLPAPPP